MHGRGAARIGLLGQLLAILLLALVVEFAASTILFERSSRAQVRDDEAHRLAEHLVIARRLLSGQPLPDRPVMAARLTTSRYEIEWMGPERLAPPTGSQAVPAYAEMLQWEPGLADSGLQVRLVIARRHPQLLGALRLGDGSWMRFRAQTLPDGDPNDAHSILLALLPAAIVLVLSTMLVRRALRPMGMLARAADRMGRSGGLTLPEAGPPEVRRVIRAFNAMQTRIHQLILDRTQALAAAGHDLRTPLARMQLRTDHIDDPGVRRAFQTDVGEMEAMVASLLSYLGGEDDPEKPVRTDVAVMAATIVDNANDLGGDALYAGADHVETLVRPIGLKRAISNLVENALHYGRCARVSVMAEGERLLVRVDDDGPGIPEDRLDEVLQPFTRLDRARSRNTRGLGLGLAIVVRAAEAEGGRLLLSNRPEGGLRAELSILRR